MNFVMGRVQNIVAKAEKAGDQLFPTMFSKGFFVRVVKNLDYVVRS